MKWENELRVFGPKISDEYANKMIGMTAETAV